MLKKLQCSFLQKMFKGKKFTKRCNDTMFPFPVFLNKNNHQCEFLLPHPHALATCMTLSRSAQSNIRTQDPGSRILDPEPRTQDLGSRIQDPGPRTQDPGSRTHDLGPRTRDLGSGTQDPSLRIQDSTIWDPGTLNFFIELQEQNVEK